MDPSCSHTLQADDESRILSALLDAFYPCISLKDIASAYYDAGNDLRRASEILCQIQDHNSSEISSQSEESRYEDNAEDLIQAPNNKGSKQKKMTAAVGSVSNMLGKAYVRPASLKKEIVEPTKPLKLEMELPDVDERDVESVKREDHLDRKDTEEFLFSMLGDGFKLTKDVIREVLGRCGYDIKKSMDELITTLDKGKGIDGDRAEEFTGELQNFELCCSEESAKNSTCVERKVKEPTQLTKDRSELSREVLVALFNSPAVLEEKPKKRLEWGLNRTRVIGQKVVSGPPDDVSLRPLPVWNIELEDDVIDKEDNYFMLRQVTREHWDKMKECYRAAVEAYSSGDRSKANALIKEGRFHNRMAREADDKSSMEILEEKKTDTDNDIPLDLHDHTARDSVYLLKKHLLDLGNMPMFRYLKVNVGTDAEDTTKGKRKRMVTKLLDRESVQWTYDVESPGTILISLNEIDRSKLTFANDKC